MRDWNVELCCQFSYGMEMCDLIDLYVRSALFVGRPAAVFVSSDRKETSDTSLAGRTVGTARRCIVAELELARNEISTFPR